MKLREQPGIPKLFFKYNKIHQADVFDNIVNVFFFQNQAQSTELRNVLT